MILLIRDDGSVDGTKQIILDYVEKYNNIYFVDELSKVHNELGIGNGFISLIDYALSEFHDIEYFGFADQDDVWENNKVFRGVQAIERNFPHKTLYFTRKKIVDENLTCLKEDSIKFCGDFSDYLSPNTAYGCTMMINRAFAEFILKSPILERPYLHDVYCCKVAICTDTIIIYDDFESVLYRQHGGNVEGAKDVSVLNMNNFKKLFVRRRHYLYGISKDIYYNYYGYLKEGYNYYLEDILRYKNPLIMLRLFVLYSKNRDRTLKEKLRFFSCLSFMAYSDGC